MVSTGFVASGTAEDRRAAVADLRMLLTPPEVPQIEAWLAELSVLAPKRASDEFEEALRLSAYTSRLGAFPADVVRYALMERPWRFWPSWHELEAVCREVTAKRLAMIAALEREDAPQPVRREEPRRRVTAKQAGAIIAEIYGDQLSEGGAA